MIVLLSIYSWLWMSFVLLVNFFAVVLVGAFTLPFDRGRYLVGRTARFVGSFAARGNPAWRFSWGGERPANPRKPYIVVSNHESNFDPFLLSYLPWEMKYLSKRALFRIPVFGWSMAIVGDIAVDRGDKNSRGRSLEGCREVLRKKVSVLIFPEGTRSRTEDLLPFRHGAFRLAIEEGVDILPVGLSGTRHALPKGSWRIHPARAHVLVGAPVSTAGLSPDDAPALAERVQGIVEDLRRQARAHCG
jgi:1-acyl-sn-glycerol-3-phosphate acyltransferase